MREMLRLAFKVVSHIKFLIVIGYNFAWEIHFDRIFPSISENQAYKSPCCSLLSQRRIFWYLLNVIYKDWFSFEFERKNQDKIAVRSMLFYVPLYHSIWVASLQLLLVLSDTLSKQISKYGSSDSSLWTMLMGTLFLLLHFSWMLAHVCV